MSRNYGYHAKFSGEWLDILRYELSREFPEYIDMTIPSARIEYNPSDRTSYLPPVDESSWVGRLAAKLPSKPQGITIGGVIYYTPHYPNTKKKFLKAHGEEGAKLYEFGMYAHEAYHALDQELTPNWKIFSIPMLSGKTRWFIKYVLNLIKTPNAYKHPSEIPAYEFQAKMKSLAHDTQTSR